ncbi:MAG: tyrosine-type recombinase/integrase [Herminiimonas sp.]|nr:tyrosine-type recombinase/integrase [Herminiimonas sp.]
MASTSTPGIQKLSDGYKVDKKFRKERIQQRGFKSFEDAEEYLSASVTRIREKTTPGRHVSHTFDEAATKYLQIFEKKTSLKTDVYHLMPVMPFIGHMQLDAIHNGTLQKFIQARKAQTVRVKIGKDQYEERRIKNKTINHTLAIVRRILNLAAGDWRDENNMTWLSTAPMITLLPLSDSREPRPIQWDEQQRLMSALPSHLQKMALFCLNTGLRDDVICNLQWSWELQDIEPIGGNSIFTVPVEHVKGEDKHVTEQVVVCNDAAQAVIESMRGKSDTHVFVYRRERVKNTHLEPTMQYAPIECMNNTAWQNARLKACLGDLHVHDLRHTVGMRLREANVADRTQDAILWHSNRTMTAHYSVAQLVEIFDALQKIKERSSRENATLQSLKHDAKMKRVTQNSLSKEKRT